MANGRMTITEVAKILGVTPKTITRWEKTGKVKAVVTEKQAERSKLREDSKNTRKTPPKMTKPASKPVVKKKK